MFLLPLLLAPVYRFPVDKPVTYQADMRFEGFLPIMGIGEGKATVHGTFEVAGKNEGAASVKLTGFEVTFNGAKVPIDLDKAQEYVPGGTFTYAPNGVVSKWDSPGVTAPIRIPGLDLRHLPEVLFLPVAFPEAGVEVGKSFMTMATLSGGTADYKITPIAVDGETVTVSLKLHQSYSGFEDSANQVVSEKDAEAKVSTEVEGSGSGVFSMKLGRFTKFTVDDVATTQATDLESKKTTTRKLSRHMDVTS